MSHNKQPFEQHGESADSAKVQPGVAPTDTSRGGASAESADANEENADSTTPQLVSTRRRVANAALAGAAFGAIASAAAAAFTGKGVSDGVKAVAEVALDKLKEAAEDLTPTVESAVDKFKETAFSTAEGSQSNFENAGDIKQAPESVKPSIEDIRGTAKQSAEDINPPVSPHQSIPPIPPSSDVAVNTGVAQDAAFKSADSVVGHTTNSVVNDATLGTANNATNNAALVQLLLSQVGPELAMSFYEQLPAVLLTEIQRLATNPTPEERQRIRDSWAKALEPVAIAIVQSVQSFNTSTALTAASNGHHPQVN